MKRNTIKWRIFKYNIVVIIMLIVFTTIIFNVAVRMYIENVVVAQLDKIALSAENTALRHGPDFFPPPDKKIPPPTDANLGIAPTHLLNDNDPFKFYFMLDRSLKEPFTLLNADFILLDENKSRITPFPEQSTSVHAEIMNEAISKLDSSKEVTEKMNLTLKISGAEYMATIKPVSDKNTFGLGWIIIYSNIQQINQLQLVINIILLLILIFSAFITIVFSSRVSQKITEPFSHLNEYISAISERNFGNKIEVPVYEELRELVDNINIMSVKLETHDKSQKTFLQNASHEFRTPLMTIQSYTEGIQHDVVDTVNAVPIILSEVTRLTNLVEDLLYLSRLDAIEENYNCISLNFNELVKQCVWRINYLAKKNNIYIKTDLYNHDIVILADEEKLSRSISNILSNCIRYAKSEVNVKTIIKDNNDVELVISDDGPGFENSELPNVFERFYKGKNGNYGLGLSISKNVIEKLNGQIIAENSESGAVFVILLPIQN